MGFDNARQRLARYLRVFFLREKRLGLLSLGLSLLGAGLAVVQAAFVFFQLFGYYSAVRLLVRRPVRDLR